MGVCVSGREGLGTPPAPPAEEALTAEHGGLIPPPPPPPITTSPLTSLLLSHLLHLSLSPLPSIYSLLFQTYWPSFFRTLTSFPTLFSHFISSTALFVHTVSSLFYCLLHCTFLFVSFFLVIFVYEAIHTRQHSWLTRSA